MNSLTIPGHCLKSSFLASLILMLLLIYACKKEEVRAPEEDITEEPILDSSVSAAIPHIYIQVEDNQKITSKEDYLHAIISIDGMGKFPDMEETPTSIRGRGHSTWHEPKKPYKIKLDDKAPVLGLPSAKKWVLLANYQDYTLMTAAVAIKIARQLNMPYANDVIPVDLTINGEYMGNYNLTQQIEAKKNRVDIGSSGALFEVDANYDEDFKFKSDYFGLPVMIKDPDIESAEQFKVIKDDFNAFESRISDPAFPGNDYGDLFDKTQLVKYLIVNNLTANYEILHPKSVYMHKKDDGKFALGPVWDFDWGFGFDETDHTYFNFIDLPLLKENDEKTGALFFKKFLEDPEIRAMYKKQWRHYRTEDFDELMEFIEQYAAEIRDSQKKDYLLWKIGDNNLPQYKADMKTYLRKRARYIDHYVESL